jgi:cobalt-zinc-cadmium resistance protein CzcA
MAVSRGAGAEVQRPLATVVIGGLIHIHLAHIARFTLPYQWIEERRDKLQASRFEVAE